MVECQRLVLSPVTHCKQSQKAIADLEREQRTIERDIARRNKALKQHLTAAPEGSGADLARQRDDLRRLEVRLTEVRERHLALNRETSRLSWLVANAFSAVAARLRREGAIPGAKRARTLIYFARSIAKLLVWVFALVTIMAEFGISPGQSAGALGVIGLVLAGMFQQLVIDFVKGIDIAAGGHYFIGDFVEVAGEAGHVLAIQVKYTVLRTPSGQVLSIPNGKCIPSRRFPSGYVDNYVDTPVPADVDVEQAKAALADVGRLLNERVEAVKQKPEFVSTSRDGSTIYIRTLVRVLPTCDWVLKDHYIPMVKRRFEAENIPLAGEPLFFHMNTVATFRRLFSRQLSESDIARVAQEEAQPTVQRPDLPDPDALPPPEDCEPRGPVEASQAQEADSPRGKTR